MTPRVVIALLVSIGACGDGAAPTGATEKAADAARGDSAVVGGPIVDPERDLRLADLDTLCAALDADYVDGTLSDYFADVSMRTPWGRDLRKRGSDADRPGRFLQAQIEQLSPGAADPKLVSCRRLLGYLDEVE